MTFPASLTLVPLHGQILKADSAGTPASGSVSFRVEHTLRDTADNVLLAPTTITATLDATGSFTVSLPATDDPDVSPQGWTYVVTIATDALRDSFRVSIPAATVGTLQLADIAPAVTPSTLATYVLVSTVGQNGGPAGPLSSGVIPSAQVPLADPASQFPSGVGQFNAVGSGAVAARWDHTHALATANGLSPIQIRGRKPTAGAPTSGTWSAGDAVLDSANAWHYCTAGGTPGTWT